MAQLRLITSIKDGKNKIKERNKYPIIKQIVKKLTEKKRFKTFNLK
jgi:hypothetical protein